MRPSGEVTPEGKGITLPNPWWLRSESLGVREPKTPGTGARTEHAVLGAQVLDRFALSATDPGSKKQNEEVKRSSGWHGRRTIADPGREKRTAEIARDRRLGHYGTRGEAAALEKAHLALDATLVGELVESWAGDARARGARGAWVPCG